MPDWMLIPGQYFACLFFYAIAWFWWRLDQAVLLAAVLINYFRQWLQTDVLDFTMSLLLQPGTGNAILPFIAGGVMLAVVLGAIFLLLRPLLIHSSPVDFRKVIFWLALIGWLFTNRGSIFHDLEGFRNTLAGSAYQTAIVVNDHITGQGYNTTNGEVPSPSAGTITIPRLFPQTTHQYGPDEITALDTAAYYLEASQDDIAAPPTGSVPVPTRFYQDYYTTGGVQYFPVPSGNDVRTAAVNHAMAGAGLMFTGLIPAIVAVIQALISLSFALAATILFFSLPIALPFAFFTSTEAIALDILRAYISLLIKTYVVNLMLAIFLGFLIFWAGSGNIPVFVSLSLPLLYFCFQFLHLALQTLHQAVATITGSIGQVTGTQLIDPVAAVKQQVGSLVQAGVAAGAVFASGGAMMPAAAGALLSSSGLPGGSALLYGAARNATPGDFARRSLASRQAASGDLTPAQAQQAEDAAGVLTGQRAGNPFQARQILSTLGAQAAQQRTAQAQIRAVMADHGLAPAPDEAQQLRGLENVIGTSLGATNLRPAEIQTALRAIAVLRDGVSGDPNTARQILQQYGERASLTRDWQAGIQQELAAVQILPARSGGGSRPSGPAAPPVVASNGPSTSAPVDASDENVPPSTSTPAGNAPPADPRSEHRPPPAGNPPATSPVAPRSAPTPAPTAPSVRPESGPSPRTPLVGAAGQQDSADFDPLAAVPLEAFAAPPPVEPTAPSEPAAPPRRRQRLVQLPPPVTESVDRDTSAPAPVAPGLPQAAPPVIESVPMPANSVTRNDQGDTADPPSPPVSLAASEETPAAEVTGESPPTPPPTPPKKSGRKDSSRFYWMHRNRPKGGSQR